MGFAACRFFSVMFSNSYILTRFAFAWYNLCCPCFFQKPKGYALACQPGMGFGMKWGKNEKVFARFDKLSL